MCRVLGVSPSGYYAWRARPRSARARANERLLERIREIHKLSDETYGSPRIHAELQDEGQSVGLNRVSRLMRRGGLVGVTRRRKWRTTKRDKDARPAPDLVQRDFAAEGPDQLWVADITYVPTGSGFLYLAVVVDAWSRRVVGWSMENHLRTDLVVRALNMALLQRRPADVIHHSDQGTQYTSIAFGLRCKHVGVRPSMGSVGDCYDNALCESFFATLECELIERRRLRESCGGEDGGLPLHRELVQPATPALSAGLQVAGQLRSEALGGSVNPSGLQAAVVLPTLADLGCLPLPCASGAAEASDSIGGAEQKKNSNTYLSTESGEVQSDPKETP